MATARTQKPKPAAKGTKPATKPAAKKTPKQPAKAKSAKPTPNAKSAKPTAKAKRAKPTAKSSKAKASPRAAKPKSSAPRTASDKVPAAIARELTAALERGEPAWQVAGLSAALAKLGTRAHAAAAALAGKTRKGSPLARAYLTALGDGPRASESANVVVQHCAAMERGRKALRDAFVAVWRKASDVDAIGEACENFERGLLEDPDLLDAGIDAAAKRGDTAAATALASRLDRAQRLQPLLADLAGGASKRARAREKLATLPAPDRWHVHARVIAEPRAYDQELTVDAIRTLADDPQVTDMALSSAIVEMRYHGNDRLIAHWKARVAAGDSATITRVLGLFEWTALWATDPDQLEPYIHALYPAGCRPEVFASVEHALAGNSMVVRQAVLDDWMRAAEGIRAFDDAQVDKLVRMTVTIAESGDDTDDRRAANRALFYTPHPGARHALMDGVRNASTENNDELRYNLYFGLSHIDHPEVLPFLVERMFVEREEYWALLEALEAKVDAVAHVRVLGTLVERADDANAIHAATVYADMLLHKKHAPRMLVDLARVIVGWQPATNDDARRLRYVFEQATAAALELVRTDDARTFLARARELPDAGYSDYLVKDRDVRTQAAFAEPAIVEQLAALETGALDAQMANARAAAETARSAGKPIAADDARLGMLAGCRVTARFVEDRATRVVWFLDEAGALHVYDGYSVVPPSCQVVGTAGRGIVETAMAAFVAGHPMIDERALLLDVKQGRAREVLRLGDRLLVHDGSGRDYWQHIAMPALGLKFATTAEARRMFEHLAAHPPAGMKRVDPWYLQRGGAVHRRYHCPRPAGDGEARLAVLDTEIEGDLDERCPALERRFASHAAAIAAIEAWETRVLAAGGRITHLWLEP